MGNALIKHGKLKWNGNILHHKGLEMDCPPLIARLQRYSMGNHRPAKAGRVGYILHVDDADPMKFGPREPLASMVFPECSPKQAREEAETIIRWALAWQELGATPTPPPPLPNP